ncbi:MAG: hypothetical protein LAP40_23605 [Acidobacteriia bacterium]|nr:hypothetical protein [Terriglobia bacterium]
MKKISVALTVDELQALVTLAENQLFRVKHIDPKMPGYIVHPEQLEVSNSAVQVIAEALKTAKQAKTRAASEVHR